MIVVARVVVGVVFLAHGLVHLLYLAPDVDAFSLDSSVLPETIRRPTGLALIWATVVAFALVALSTWGVPGLAGAWPVLTIVAAAISAVLLVAFWDWQLVVGLAIDAVLVVLALWQPGWLGELLPDLG